MVKNGPKVIASVAALFIMLDFFFKQSTLNRLGGMLVNWAVVIAAFALGLASVNLARTHINRIARRGKDWYASGVLLAFLFGISMLGIVSSPSHPQYMFWFDSVYNTCHATMGSLLIFFIATASFRAFRMRTFESTILLICATIVMLGQAPIGAIIFSGFPKMSSWLLDVVNLSGQRGIMITAGLGAISASLRVLLGLERG